MYFVATAHILQSPIKQHVIGETVFLSNEDNLIAVRELNGSQQVF